MAPKKSAPATSPRRKKLTVAETAMYNRNATDSPLLRLPPEIRNRIYRLVLGGQDIHVKAHEAYVSFTLCQHPSTSRSVAQSIIADGKEIGQETWQSDHLGCLQTARLKKHMLRPGQLLGLLQVCHQTHQESALLPFLCNTFIFGSGYDVDLLVRKLNPDQRKAVRSISFQSRFAEHFTERPPRNAVMARLGDLKHLTILANITTHTSPAIQVERRARSCIAAVKTAMKRTDWVSVVMCITAAGERNKFGLKVISSGDYREEARETERVLLEPWDEIGYQEGIAKGKFQERQALREQRGLRRLKAKE